MRFDPTVIILDGGHPRAQALARAVRSLGFFSLILPAGATPEKVAEYKPAALILAQGHVPLHPGLAAQVELTMTAPGMSFTPTPRPQEQFNLYWLLNADLHNSTVLQLAGFLLGQKKLCPTFIPETLLARMVEEIKAQVGEGRVLLGLSGGVDSAVCAALIHRAIGPRLTSLFVDHGLMRAGEPAEVVRQFRDGLGLNLEAVDASEQFVSALAGVLDPEQKRKTVGRLFIELFEVEAAKLGAVEFLGQGTIYPDIIESEASADGGAAIKSHHNVGGLPERMNMKLVEPLKYLFKDEVRVLGLALGMDPEQIYRQPFPGPGLAVRCLGEVTTERLTILKAADLVVRQEIGGAHLEGGTPWQYFAILLPVKSVGIRNCARCYEQVVAIRAIETTDALAAKPSALPFELLMKMSRRILSEVPGVNRVVYDISEKPPATIEWE